MTITLFLVLFLISSIFILLKIIGYALYEINTLHNKIGGIVTIIFSCLVIIFSNVVAWLYY